MTEAESTAGPVEAGEKPEFVEPEIEVGDLPAVTAVASFAP